MKYAITCGKMVNKDGRIEENAVIHVESGKISRISRAAETGECIVDASRLWVTPGLIEAHCHAVADLDDLNEETSPISISTRAYDAIDPFSADIPFVRRAGFTTLCVLPGSAELMGGSGVVIKLKPAKTVDEMAVFGREPFKMALGENPKRIFGAKGVLPCTRMGNMALLRRTFLKAVGYLKEKESGTLQKEDPDMEVLASVLKREKRVRIHCHAAQDIVCAVHLAKEFGLDYVLEHVTQGDHVAQWLKEENVPCCVGPVLLQPIKRELKKSIMPTLPAALETAGLHFALMSDENLGIVYLPMAVGCSVAYGLSWAAGMRAITIQAAKVLQIEDRVGSLEPGKDADIAFFDGDPLVNTTRCVGTMIDGVFCDKNF